MRGGWIVQLVRNSSRHTGWNLLDANGCGIQGGHDPSLEVGEKVKNYKEA